MSAIRPSPRPSSMPSVMRLPTWASSTSTCQSRPKKSGKLCNPREAGNRRGAMFPKPFDYVMPATLDEAIQKLQQDKAMALAGGNGLIPAMSLGRAAPALLVDLRQLADLAGLAPRTEGGWRIGALTTYATLATSQALQENYPALAEAIRGLSDPAVRNRAT